MAVAKPHLPSVRFAAVFGQQATALDWACEMATAAWGELLLQSADFDFGMTRFYEKSMGSGLRKRLIAFRDLVDPVELVSSKVQSNQWEQQYRERNPGDVDRPVNIDPGYLTEAKVVLMTTKDRDHRLYVGQGIYAEVTLFYQLPGNWIASRWTYPDYQLAAYHEFFGHCRDYLRQRLQETRSSS